MLSTEPTCVQFPTVLSAYAHPQIYSRMPIAVPFTTSSNWNYPLTRAEKQTALHFHNGTLYSHGDANGQPHVST